MIVTFRCKRSGNTVSFTDEHDIAGLRVHDGYEEVIENAKETKDSESDSSNPHEGKNDGKERKAGNEAGNEEEKSKLLVPKKRGPKPKK